MNNFGLIESSLNHLCYYNQIDNKYLLKTIHNGGFFSCCSKRLDEIVNFFNKYKKLPDILDSSLQFNWYKQENNKDDLTSHYFEDNKIFDISYENHIDFNCEKIQFTNYKSLNLKQVDYFIKKYFEPSVYIKNEIKNIEDKYMVDYNNTCVLFYRGNDKETETKLPNYVDYINYAKEIQTQNKDIRFIIQSDETEFINTMKNNLTNYIVFEDEIRHISKNKNLSVDMINKNINLEYSKKFLAITLIMSKCKFLICNSGNCSLWICLYRKNLENVKIYLNSVWF